MRILEVSHRQPVPMLDLADRQPTNIRPVVSRRIRFVPVVGILLAAMALFGASFASAAQARVLVANCGTTGYSSVEPDYWSAGCTSGSPTIEPIEWLRYGHRLAVGSGTALVQNCGCAYPTATAEYPAGVVLSHPKSCRDSPRRKFFSKARLKITYPEGNPFGESPGDHYSTFHVPRGHCEPAP